MKKTFLFISFFMLLFSCTSNNDETSEAPITHKTQSTAISQSEAIEIAKNAVLSLKKEKTPMYKLSPLKVSSINTTKNQNIKTRSAQDENFFYIINFEEGGYAVVANDKRATEIYAISDEGSFKAESNNGTKLFLELAKEQLKNEIGISIKDSLFNPFNPNLPDPNDPSIYAIVNYGGQMCHDVTKETKTTPFYLLDTKWGQGWPYNYECFTTTGEQAVTGCAAIAMGQIMRYHKQPQTYNGHQYFWDYMPIGFFDYNYSPEAYSVALLVHDIGKALNMNYGINKSTSYVNNVPNALSKFGYTCDGVQDIHLGNVITSLNLGRPVYMRGTDSDAGGHAWVVDGFFKVTIQHTLFSVENLVKVGEYTETNVYLHVNWGGYGDGDGYFYSKAFNVNGYKFNSTVKNIYNIKYAN